MKKTVLITGASKGIGKATAIEFAKNGYDIAISYLTSEKEASELKNTVEKLYNVKVLTIKVDISNEKDVINMVSEVKDKFGKIDVLINNAAYYNDNNYLDKTKDEFMRVLEVNVVGTYLVTKYATKIIDKGTVINVSSRDSVDTYNELSMDYCASKAGVNSLAQTFSLALPNIKFISVLLPWVSTESVQEMYPEYLQNELKRTNQKRLVEPDEVAKVLYDLINENIKSGSIIRKI